MTKTFFADRAALMSPRTAKYVEALVREGDNFDYHKWLERVREEETQAKQGATAITWRDVVAARVNNPINTSDSRDARPNPALRLMPRTIQVPRALRSRRQANTPKARLRRWLQKVRGAWDDFQANRARDAVYGYMEAVFAIVEHYRVRRRTKRLLRHAFDFANLPFDKNADAFTAVIRCTCGDAADSKTISKWARALRYVARCKPTMGLREFMKGAGGVNACADGYARLAPSLNRAIRKIPNV
jgi:hypothetical protein